MAQLWLGDSSCPYGGVPAGLLSTVLRQALQGDYNQAVAWTGNITKVKKAKPFLGLIARIKPTML